MFARFVLFTCLHNFQHLYGYKYSAFHQYSDKNKVKYLRILVLLVYNKIISKYKFLYSTAYGLKHL